jgi:hypothetical protein
MADKSLQLCIPELLLFRTRAECLIRKTFGTSNIDLLAWMLILLIASLVLFLVEIEKAIIRYMERKK